MDLDPEGIFRDDSDYDSDFFQVVCGKQAGAVTCLLDETGRYVAVDSLTDDTRPDFNVPALAEIHSLGDPFRITLCSNCRMNKIAVKCNDSWNQTANLRAYDWYV